ncbi:hypothetical protein, partial [Enterococcus faecium]|uniref:hypothetical protein n=1 Tax=Enterococcus faecium TaxID=1352 RepID=UPI003DA1C495
RFTIEQGIWVLGYWGLNYPVLGALGYSLRFLWFPIDQGIGVLVFLFSAGYPINKNPTSK